jgi:hypothetical protein
VRRSPPFKPFSATRKNFGSINSLGTRIPTLETWGFQDRTNRGDKISSSSRLKMPFFFSRKISRMHVLHQVIALDSVQYSGGLLGATIRFYFKDQQENIVNSKKRDPLLHSNS